MLHFLKFRQVIVLALLLTLTGCGGGSGEDSWTGEPLNLTGLVSAGRNSTDGDYTLEFYTPGFWVIYARQNRDTIDNAKPVAISMGQNVIIETPPENVRWFFEAYMGQGKAFFSENHIPLAGQDNFRDMGGYPGESGTFIKYGCLYRSGKLSDLTPGDIAYLASMALAEVIDLRSEKEIIDNPDLLPEGVQWNNIVLNLDVDFNSLMKKIIDGEVDAYESMIDLFSSDIDDARIAAWIDIFDVIEQGASVMFHCSGGKDRTGMTAALLLKALGVDRNTVVDDFAKTTYYLKDYIEETVAEVEHEYPGSGERVRPMLEAKPEYIKAFLGTVEAQFGSMDNFLRNIIKVDVDLIREQFLQ